MNTEEINIVFTLSDKTGNYSATFGTTIASIFENTDFNKVVIKTKKKYITIRLFPKE